MTLVATSTPWSVEIRRAGEAQASGGLPGDGALLAVQHASPDHRPFIHPIGAPDGRGVLTENVPPHHPWQHGLYVGHNDVNGVGFWTEGLQAGSEGRDGSFHSGKIGMLRSDSPDVVNWSIETDWLDPAGVPMLVESQSWSLCDSGVSFTLDLRQTIVADIDLRFGRYDYGGLFLRMPYRAGFGGEALTSEGDRGFEGEGKRARWVAVSMPIEGRDGPAGIALMDSPRNQGHPVPWRIDGQLGIGPSPCIAGEWRIAALESREAYYRAFVFSGPIVADAIDRSWREWTGL